MDSVSIEGAEGVFRVRGVDYVPVLQRVAAILSEINCRLWIIEGERQ